MILHPVCDALSIHVIQTAAFVARLAYIMGSARTQSQDASGRQMLVLAAASDAQLLEAQAAARCGVRVVVKAGCVAARPPSQKAAPGFLFVQVPPPLDAKLIFLRREAGLPTHTFIGERGSRERTIMVAGPATEQALRAAMPALRTLGVAA